MAGYIIHSIVGLITGAVCFFLLNVLDFIEPTKTNILIAILYCIAYSLLPDIDYKNSIMKTTMRFFLISLIALYIFLHEGYFVVVLVFILLFPSLFRHRGFIHSITAGVLFSLPLLFIGWQFCIIGFFSFLSHLMVDGKVRVFAWG